MKTRKPWRISHGPKGARVTVGERSFGSKVCIWAWDPSINGSRRRSLGYHLRDSQGKLIAEAVDRAKRDAATASNRLLRGEHASTRTTVGLLFDLFRDEELVELKGQHRKETARELACLERFLGRGMDAEKIGPREWNSLRRARASGEIDSRGKRVADVGSRKAVSERTVGRTLQALRQVCRFGARYRRRDGTFLLSGDPTRGLALPRNQNPARPVATTDRVARLLAVANKVQMRTPEGMTRAPFRELLVLAHQTGRRIGSLVVLRWNDWLADEGTFGSLRFRAESDKLSQDWIVPVTSEVRVTLEAYRQETASIAEALMFPRPMRGGGHIDVPLAGRWLRRAEVLAGLPHPPRSGWHSFRRGFATGRKGRSIRDVAYLGGWKGTQVLQEPYQQPDVDGLEDALFDPAPVRMVR